MSVFVPIFRPGRCGPSRVVRNDFAPLLSLLDDTLSQAVRAPRHHARRPPFAPRFNVSEGSDYYTLEGELPGVEQKNISVEFTGENTLTIRGRVEERTQKGKAPATEAVEEPKQADTIEGPIDAESVRSHQPTVEDDKEWTEVDTPAAESSSASTATAHAEEPAAPSEPAAQESQPQPEQPRNRSWLSERYVGEFSRSFSFSERVNQDTVRASLANGVLSIVVPKAAKPELRKITVE